MSDQARALPLALPCWEIRMGHICNTASLAATLVASLGVNGAIEIDVFL